MRRTHVRLTHDMVFLIDDVARQVSISTNSFKDRIQLGFIIDLFKSRLVVHWIDPELTFFIWDFLPEESIRIE